MRLHRVSDSSPLYDIILLAPELALEDDPQAAYRFVAGLLES